MGKKIAGSQIKTFRAKKGISQKNFWNLLGVTQSAGSRYENGRSIPKPTQALLSLSFGIGDAEKLQRDLLSAADKLMRDGAAKLAEKKVDTSA